MGFFELLRVLFIFGLAVSSTLTFAGVSGGGGVSVVCRNKDSSIHSAEILDLYEGRKVYDLAYTESPEEWKSQATSIMKSAGLDVTPNPIRSSIYDFFINAAAYLRILPDDTGLKPIDDSHEVIVPKDCAIEQTVNYLNDNKILVDGSIWKVLSETQKAALIIHEAVYRFLRANGETNSRRARHFTAFIVSGDHVEQPQAFKKDLYCEGGEANHRTEFFGSILPGESSGEGMVRFQFSKLGGRRLLSQAFADLSADLLEQLKRPSHSTYRSAVLESRFEPGDRVNLWIHNTDSTGKWKIELSGTSIVDESLINANLNCVPLTLPAIPVLWGYHFGRRLAEVQKNPD